MHSYREEFGHAMDDIYKAITQINPDYEEIRKIGELVRFSVRASSSGQFSEIETNHLESWISRGQHVLQRSYTMEESLALRYYSKDLQEDPWKAIRRGMAVMMSLSGIEAREAKINRRSSVWRETLKSLNGLAKGTSEVLTDKGLNGHHTATWFIVLNALETMSAIIQGEGHDTEDKHSHSASTAEEIQAQFEDIVTEHTNSLKSNFEHSTGLHVYAYDLAQQEILTTNVTEPDLEEIQSERTKIFHILGKLRRQEYDEITSLPKSEPNEKPHLWAIARAWIRASKNEPSGVIPFFKRINIDSVFQEVWSSKQSSIQSRSLNPKDLEEIRSMDDEAIQQKLNKIFSDNTSISPTSRSALSQELNKAHGSSEISDFDIEIDRGNKNSIFVSFPIKSGKETNKASTSQITEQHLHQILRPFVRFDKCAIFPIIISSHTLAMNETIKELRSQLDIPIRIIDEELFGKILKSHDLL